MRIPIVAVVACVFVQPLACSHEGDTQAPVYGSDNAPFDKRGDTAQDQPGVAPLGAGGSASDANGPNVGGTNMTGGTGGTGGSTSSGGTGATGGTRNGNTGGSNGGTSP